MDIFAFFVWKLWNVRFCQPCVHKSNPINLASLAYSKNLGIQSNYYKLFVSRWPMDWRKNFCWDGLRKNIISVTIGTNYSFISGKKRLLILCTDSYWKNLVSKH